MIGSDAAAQDDTRQHGLSTLRLLLSPGRSERLVRRSTDEWSSSKAVVSAEAASTLALLAEEARRSAELSRLRRA
jgi:hypothetical protein